jgi:hypothetical protein
VKYALLIYSNPEAFDAADKTIATQYMAFSQEILDSGEMVAGDAFQHARTATSVRVRDGRTATTNGPFATTTEILTGYYVIDAKDLDRAVELAAKIPDARTGAVEIRPLADIPA